jgi:hypothetical protein
MPGDGSGAVLLRLTMKRFGEMILHRNNRFSSKLPEDTEVVDVWRTSQDRGGETITVKLTSTEFKRYPEGCELPYLVLVE